MGTNYSDTVSTTDQQLSDGVPDVPALNADATEADTTPPAAPVVALAVDSGASATDRITNNGTLVISGLESGATWEYSTDKGAHWQTGTPATEQGTATLDLGTTSTQPQTLMARTTDAAGNVSAVTSYDYTVQKYLAGLLNAGKTGAEVWLNNKSLNPYVMIAGLNTGTTRIYQVSPTGSGDDFRDWHPGDALADGTWYFRATGADIAGNTYISNTVTVHLDNAAPVQGVAFDHLGNGAQYVLTTTQAKTDVVFTYTGTIESGAWVEYGTSNVFWTRSDALTIDTAAKTITYRGLDLSTSDQSLRVRVVDAAGNAIDSGYVKIDGPYTKYTTQATSAGLKITSEQDAHIYLTPLPGEPVRILSSDPSGDALKNLAVTVGVQQSAVSGVLGVGPSTSIHTDNYLQYGFGSNGNDVLRGQYAWGYGGDDSITAIGNNATINGGAGADAILATSGSTRLVYGAAQDSVLVADDASAHGFDTITVNTTSDAAAVTHKQTFQFAVAADGFVAQKSPAVLAGTETGNELFGLINSALQLQAGKHNAAVVGFDLAGSTQPVNFLVLDADGDGRIGAADHVVKIVGTIDAGAALVSAGMLVLPTA